MGKNHLKLQDLPPYRIAYRLSNEIWEIVSGWEWLEKSTIGQQWIRSSDSISANVAEGFGRHFKRDRSRFYYNARGSLYETVDWINKAKERELISDNKYNELNEELRKLPKEINGLIKFTREKLKE